MFLYLAALFVILLVVGIRNFLENLPKNFLKGARSTLLLILTVKDYFLIRLRDMILSFYGVEYVNAPGGTRFTSELRFVLPRTEGVWYMRFPRKRMCEVSNVVTEGDIDVTDRVLRYLGPGYNFYGIPTTPHLLGYNNLRITYSNRVVVEYSANTPISPSGPIEDVASAEDII